MSENQKVLYYRIGDRVRFNYSPECVCPNCGQECGHVDRGSIIATIDRVDTVYCSNCSRPLPLHHYISIGLFGASADELELVRE